MNGILSTLHRPQGSQAVSHWRMQRVPCIDCAAVAPTECWTCGDSGFMRPGKCGPSAPLSPVRVSLGDFRTHGCWPCRSMMELDGDIYGQCVAPGKPSGIDFPDMCFDVAAFEVREFCAPEHGERAA